MRKQNYIVMLNAKDKTFLTVLKNSQHISKRDALGIISNNRLNNYQKQGLLKKVHYIHKGRKEIAYALTGKGCSFIIAHYPELGRNFYRSTTAVYHNVMLAREIINQQQQGREWINERDIRQEFMQAIERIDDTELRFQILAKLERGEISMPDGAVRSEHGELICIEIVSDNYSQAHIAAKEECAEMLSASIEFIR